MVSKIILFQACWSIAFPAKFLDLATSLFAWWSQVGFSGYSFLL